MGSSHTSAEGQDRSHFGLPAVGLLLATAAAFLVLPEPGWWHIGYPLDAAATTNDPPLTHPAPGAVLPMLLFAWSGLATWAVIPANRSLLWRLVVGCTFVNVPFAAILYDQRVYDSMFGLGRSPSILRLAYATSGYLVFLLAVATLLLYVVMAARWAGPLILRALRLDRWWNRSKFTEREFLTDVDALAVAKRWAEANRAELILSGAGRHSYQLALSTLNGKALFGLSLTIEQSGDRIRIFAGMANDGRMRLLTVGMLPAVMPLSSGGFFGVFGRRRGRRLANELLGQLGGPLIE